MDENQNVGNVVVGKKEIPWRLVGFVVAAALAAIFVLSNREMVNVSFLGFEAETRQWVSLVVAVALGVLADRLFIVWRRHKNK